MDNVRKTHLDNVKWVLEVFFMSVRLGISTDSAVSLGRVPPDLGGTSQPFYERCLLYAEGAQQIPPSHLPSSDPLIYEL